MAKKKEKKATVLSKLIEELRKPLGNKAQVARKLAISPQLLGQYESGMQRPKLEFFNKWKEVFEHDLIELEKERNVSHETNLKQNGTPAMKSTDQKQKDLVARATAFQEIMDTYTEYALVHKSLLENHRFTSKEQMARDERLVDKLLEKLEKQRNEIEKLKIKIGFVEKGQKNA
jgi:transcriptional regulator with XRE-family HTH domain